MPSQVDLFDNVYAKVDDDLYRIMHRDLTDKTAAKPVGPLLTSRNSSRTPQTE